MVMEDHAAAWGTGAERARSAREIFMADDERVSS
jgi:hypothetical protein